MTDFRKLLPPDVRTRIEEREAAGVSLDEQGRQREPEPRPVAPAVPVDEVEHLFGVVENPQDGTVAFRVIEGSRRG